MHGQSPASPEGGRYLSRVGGGVVALGQTGERHPWISFFKPPCHKVHTLGALEQPEITRDYARLRLWVPHSVFVGMGGSMITKSRARFGVSRETDR